MCFDELVEELTGKRSSSMTSFSSCVDGRNPVVDAETCRRVESVANGQVVALPVERVDGCIP